MILICDDDATIRSSLSLVLKRAGYEVASAENPHEALGFVRGQCPELILMDMNYSKTTTGEEGLELLRKTRVFCPDVPVILITAWGSIGLAVRGIRAGAFDFVTKPWNNLALLNTIRTAIQVNEESKEQARPAESTAKTVFRRERIIGGGAPARRHGRLVESVRILCLSPRLTQVLDTASRIARTTAPVLITGESGTGKELIAEAIHQNSKRSKSPFVKVNLGGISQSLFESEMFGHKKGAFTDAFYDRTGRFETADKGSIFLDEIGELDMVSQVKLLRVLQDQTFEPLGDSRQKQVDTRIISATNRNLQGMVRDGSFREDLFYRINLITIRMPALRERPDDIPLLVDHFVGLQRELNGIRAVEVSAEAIDYLQKLPYPGNIRELKNLVDRTILVSDKNVLTDRDFKAQYSEISSATAAFDSVHSLEEIEKNMIRKAAEQFGNNHTKIATALGLSRQALYRRLEKYGIRLPE